MGMENNVYGELLLGLQLENQKILLTSLQEDGTLEKHIYEPGREEELPEQPVVPDYDLAMDVRKAFFVLSEEEQILVGLSVFGGYCSQEIGEMMGLNPNTVRSKRSRALKKMECVLGSYGEDEKERRE